jgi:hypothetical protein
MQKAIKAILLPPLNLFPLFINKYINTSCGSLSCEDPSCPERQETICLSMATPPGFAPYGPASSHVTDGVF